MNINRRNFLKGTTAAMVLSSFGAYGIDLMHSEKPIRVGLIGAGWYGKSDLFRLMQVTNTHVISICDVDRHMGEEAQKLIALRQKSKKTPRLYSDYRKMLAKKDLDIVLIASPDHWHALQGIEALKSGAHVYLQKPISVDVVEGEALIAAAQKYGKVIQVGTQRKSTPHLIDAKKSIVDTGMLGKIAHVEMCCYYHMRDTKVRKKESIPDFFNYNLWTGPAPLLDFKGLPHRRWRAFMEYGNGITGDMCVHMFDTVRWMLGLGWPKTISSSGGIYVQKDADANISDTQTAVFEYEDLDCVWNHRTWGAAADPDYPWSFKIYGEKGTLKGSVMKYEFVPVGDGKAILKDVVYEREKFPQDLTEKDIELHAAPATRGHMIDFLAALQKGTPPIANIQEGHISTASCILANMAMKLKRPLIYNQNAMRINDDPEATRLLQRGYREGWKHPVPGMF